MLKLTIGCAAALAAGCGGGFDPVGAYSGNATRTGQVTRQLTDLQPDGTLTADTRRFNAATSGATVTVRRLDPTHLEIDIGEGCKVRVQQSPEPNEGNAIVPPNADQTCHIEVDGYTGDIRLDGTATFTKQEPQTINVILTGQARVGDDRRTGYVAVDWAFNFNGPRPAS